MNAPTTGQDSANAAAVSGRIEHPGVINGIVLLSATDYTVSRASKVPRHVVEPRCLPRHVIGGGPVPG
jgi:hypothetical protein